jgi:hypothetical protein
MMQTMTLLGPLIVSAANPRYFTVASGDSTEQRAIYLTGSHIWNNFHNGMGPGTECPETPEQFDDDAYLRFLTERGLLRRALPMVRRQSEQPALLERN